MDLLTIYNQAKTLPEYEELIGDQLPLYKLHFKKAKVPDTAQEWPTLKILVITMPQCGDSISIIPVLHKYFETTPTEIRIVLREEYPQLMDQFLTNGARSVPVVIVLDKKGMFVTRFGPRPAAAQNIFEAHRQSIMNGSVDKQEVSKKIRTFYAKDQGKTIIADFLNTLKQALTEVNEVDFP
ncbi:MAG: hypothetical protein GF313_03925 [Caldithrix sp.]|nr:hypothetical protein [Caldithrix sp.]